MTVAKTATSIAMHQDKSSVSITVNMQKAMGDIFHMLYVNLRNLWGIPLPSVQAVIPDLEGSDFIIMDNDKHIRADLRVGFILLESSEGAQAAEIVSIGRYIIAARRNSRS